MAPKPELNFPLLVLGITLLGLLGLAIVYLTNPEWLAVFCPPILTP